MKQPTKRGGMNQRMWAVAQRAAGLDDSPVNDEKAVECGRFGGISRAKALSPAKRVEIAEAARSSSLELESGSEGRTSQGRSQAPLVRSS
jgi:hypothetical protein